MSVLEKLGAIQCELKAPKGQYNSFGKYKYRSCEDILEAVKPLLVKHKCALMITDDLRMVGEHYYISSTATLYDTEDGGSVANTAFAREDEQKKGMDGSQITGTASSYARKYALNGLLLCDDTKDADTDAYHEQTHADKKPPEDPKVAAAVAKANDVKKLLVKISGDKAVAKQLWDERYAKDKGDIVKMNAALLELQEKWKAVEEMQKEMPHDA